MSDEEQKEMRSFEEWAHPSFQLLAQPDTEYGVAVVFNEDMTSLMAACPSAIYNILTKSGAYRVAETFEKTYLRGGCPVCWGLIEAAVKRRTDPFDVPVDDTSELTASPPIAGKQETIDILLPALQRLANDRVVSEPESPEQIRRRLKALARSIETRSGIPIEDAPRIYAALNAARAFGHQAETHPRYVAYRSAFDLGMALMKDAGMGWEAPLDLMTQLLEIDG